MRYSEYAPHLGWRRFSAFCRLLYDGAKDAEKRRDDDLRAKDAAHAVKISGMQRTIDGLMETIARKNGYAPIQPDTRPVASAQQPRAIVSGPDALAFRQSQADSAAKVAAVEQEKERDRAFADEAREIINR